MLGGNKKIMKIAMENTMQKQTYVLHAFRHQCQQHRQLGNSRKLWETWVNMFFSPWLNADFVWNLPYGMYIFSGKYWLNIGYK